MEMSSQQHETEGASPRANDSVARSLSDTSVHEYEEAVKLALAQDPDLAQTPFQARPRVLVEIAKERTKAEELSFKYFDGQCLQYGDRIVDGFYDVWGDFAGTKDNTPVTQFPSLQKLTEVAYSRGDVREVLVFDKENDTKLRQLFTDASSLVARCRKRGASACVQELALLVANAMGGKLTHQELVEKFNESSSRLKGEHQSVVRHIGELEIGLSRHRSILFKALADSCGLPCKTLRGLFYLGAAGADGQNAVAVVQFNNLEWMVELVTRPGRLFQLKQGSIPQASSDSLWGQGPHKRTGFPSTGHTHTSAHAYPTMPAGDSDEGIEDSDTSRSSSSAQKDGLAWSDIDGPTMNELESRSYSLNHHRQSQDKPKTAQQRSDASEHQLSDLNRRLTMQRGASASQSCSTGSDPDNYNVWLQQERAHDASAASQDAATEYGSEASGEWEPWEEKNAKEISFELQGPETSVKVIEPGKSGSNQSTGPARARVRGTDHRGRTVEFELEGLTLTSAHNLQLAPKLADTRHSEDSPWPKSLESMISRYRIVHPPKDERKRRSVESGTTRDMLGVEQQASKSLGHEGKDAGVRMSLRSLALSPDAGQQAQAEWKSQASASSGGNSSKVGLSSGQIEEGRQWHDRVQRAVSDQASDRRNSEDNAMSSGEHSSDRRAFGNQQFMSQSRARLPSQTSQDSHSEARSTSQLSGGSGERHSERLGPDAGKVKADSSQSGNESALMRDNLMVLANQLRSNRSSGDHYMQGSADSSSGISSSTLRSMLRSGTDSSSAPSDPYLTRGGLRSLQSNLELQANTPTTSMLPLDGDDVEVDFNDIELGPRIGIGCFGEVFKARWRATTIAVKRLFDQSLSETSLREFKAEVQLNRRMKHPNVIMFMGACTVPPNLSIITQWAPKGSLFHLLHQPKPGAPKLTLRQKLRMALDIARGMHYLHSAKPPVIHRDLKSMNLLVDNDLSIKVCDFGLARIRSSTWMTGRSQGGTPEWTAPEVLRNLNYNEKSDVYSFGVVLYELATEKEPWDDMTPMQVVGAVGWGGNRLEPPADCPPIFAKLMRRCFKGPEERPSFEEAMRTLLKYAAETRPSGSSSHDD